MAADYPLALPNRCIPLGSQSIRLRPPPTCISHTGLLVLFLLALLPGICTATAAAPPAGTSISETLNWLNANLDRSRLVRLALGKGVPENRAIDAFDLQNGLLLVGKWQVMHPDWKTEQISRHVLRLRLKDIDPDVRIAPEPHKEHHWGKEAYELRLKATSRDAIVYGEQFVSHDFSPSKEFPKGNISVSMAGRSLLLDIRDSGYPVKANLAAKLAWLKVRPPSPAKAANELDLLFRDQESAQRYARALSHLIRLHGGQHNLF